MICLFGFNAVQVPDNHSSWKKFRKWSFGVPPRTVESGEWGGVDYVDVYGSVLPESVGVLLRSIFLFNNTWRWICARSILLMMIPMYNNYWGL